MSDLWWPADERAGDLMSDEALLAAMVTVEQAWLDALVADGVAPTAARADLSAVPLDATDLARRAAAGGNPVIPLVADLRAAVGGDAARWLHRGLTSQDVVDTALVLCTRDAAAVVAALLCEQAELLAALAVAHRRTPMAARTLTQHAVPTTFGLKAAGWLAGVCDAHDAVAALRWPLQAGGAAGTLAAAVELTGDVSGATALVARTAETLGLDEAAPWHTARAPLTRAGDALVTATDAWGRLARDVLELGRPEVGELAEGSGGGSSTMPHKANPVLSTLVRRAALTAPQLAATLHLAAAEQVDERADGSWHAEWAALRDLGRRAVVAGGQMVELLGGLRVHPDRMAATLAAAADDLHAEHRTMAQLAGRPAAGDYLGAAEALVDRAVARAGRLPEPPTTPS